MVMVMHEAVPCKFVLDRAAMHCSEQSCDVLSVCKVSAQNPDSKHRIHILSAWVLGYNDCHDRDLYPVKLMA